MIKKKNLLTRKIYKKKNLRKKRLSKKKLIGGVLKIKNSIIEEIDRIISKMESEPKYKDKIFEYKLESTGTNESSGLELGKKIPNRQKIVEEITKRINKWITKERGKIDLEINKYVKETQKNNISNNNRRIYTTYQTGLLEQREEFEKIKTKVNDIIRMIYIIKTAKKYNLEITNSNNIETKYRSLKNLSSSNAIPQIEVMLSELIENQLQKEALARQKEAEEVAKAEAEAARLAAAEAKARAEEEAKAKAEAERLLEEQKKQINEEYKGYKDKIVNMSNNNLESKKVELEKKLKEEVKGPDINSKKYRKDQNLILLEIVSKKIMNRESQKKIQQHKSIIKENDKCKSNEEYTKAKSSSIDTTTRKKSSKKKKKNNLK